MDPDSSRGPAPAGSRKPPSSPIALIIVDSNWRRFVKRAEAVARRAALIGGGGGRIVLASDRMVKRLNARHRGRNTPTNVLTFVDGAGSGDIVLALGVVRREARDSGKLPADHLAHLIVHGALHLRGHEHDRPGDARRMELAEARLLHRMQVPNPWKST